MRTLKLIAIGIILFASSTIHAQVSVSLNIGSPPSWGPVGYAEADYYYLPDVEAYYDIRATQFIYFGGGRWIRSRYLPGQYRNYDLYSGYKVVLNDYHGSRPYRNFNNDRVRYYRGYQGREQRNIGYSNNRRGNDKHRQFDNHREYDNRRGNDNRRDNDNRRGNEGHNQGNGRGNGNGHGRD
ncbi:hypothetical protein [Flavobacterium sp. LB1P62]|uniref:hypothetical protein n=1 Tax=Flavobacterium sp. LB1P62 TaxID=3401715 RepID=UPI003AAE5D13